MPIAPQRELGDIIVTIKLTSQVVSSKQELNIKIIPEGATVHRHTSLLLDLKIVPTVLNNLNIILDETPLFKSYLLGSPQAHVTLCGDALGPVFPGNEPVRLDRMWTSRQNSYQKGTEYHTFNMAANLLQLHYFRLTYQLSQNWKLVKQV